MAVLVSKFSHPSSHRRNLAAVLKPTMWTVGSHPLVPARSHGLPRGVVTEPMVPRRVPILLTDVDSAAVRCFDGGFVPEARPHERLKLRILLSRKLAPVEVTHGYCAIDPHGLGKL